MEWNLLAKAKGVMHATLAVSGALQTEAEYACRMFKVAARKYCLVKCISFGELEDPYYLETGFDLHQDVNLLLTSLSYIARSARSKTSFAHDVFCKNRTAKAVRFMSNYTAFGAHSQSSCSHLV